MRAYAGLLILIGLILIVGSVSADMADSGSTITTSKVWVVAKPGDTSTITVVAQNSTPGLHVVPGAQVTFTIDNNVDIQGSMSPATATADSSGVATSTFISGKKSGTAIIKATIVSSDGGIPHTEVKTLNQDVDHYLAQDAVFTNPLQLIVGTVTNFNITVTDVWGNPVDNRNPAETHQFNIYMPGGNGRGIWDGSAYVSQMQVQTDAYGNVPAQYRIGYTAGPTNQVYMDAIGNMVAAPDTWIVGVADPLPCYVVQTKSADALPADGSSQFTLSYAVKDKYTNYINDTRIHITASDGTSIDKNTSIDGMIYTTFGPKDHIGNYTINATPVSNMSFTNGARCDNGDTGSCHQYLEYYNTDPVDLMVMANPQGMASIDVDSAAKGLVQARVVDIKGNPVIGETVSFSMGTPVYDYTYHVTSDPYITPTSAMTAAGGFATVTFRPGGFASYNLSDPLYNATATGLVVVTASWTNKSGTVISRDVTFVWKNYPYLGITVPSDICKDVAVGNKINMTILITGDGAALKPKPINAILVMDSSGSMGGGMSGPDGAKTKIWYSNSSGYAFVNQMNSATDQIGLVTYSTNANYPVSISTNFAAVKSGLKGMVASGSTNQRMATHDALQKMIALGADPSKTVQAIIVMTDGQYNQDGDPLARNLGLAQASEGSWGDGSAYWYIIPDLGASTDPRQNLSYWARSNNVRIYTVTFGTDAAIQPGTALYNLMTSIAEITGGKHYHATDGSQALDVYTKIAGDLKETAGGNTVATLDNSDIKVNDVMGGGDILDYMQYEADLHSPVQVNDSTYINKSHLYSNGSTYAYTGYPHDQDDTAQWATKTMVFTPGDIKLDDTWIANFRLNLTQAGKVELFGPYSKSKICFTDASTDKTTCQFIPALQCNIQESLQNVGFSPDSHLSVDILSATNNGVDPNILTIKWNTTYDGNKTATETLTYKENTLNAQPIPIYPGGVVYETKGVDKTKYLTIDTTSWNPGPYTISIVASAPDSNVAGDQEGWTKPSPAERKYIKLE